MYCLSKLFPVAAALSLVGCGSAPCTNEPPPDVGACMVPDSGWDTSLDESRFASFEARVEEVGTGGIPEACFVGGHPGQTVSRDDAWVRVSDTETNAMWTIGVEASGISLEAFLSPGQLISVVYVSRYDEWDPQRGKLILRDADGGLMFWMSAGNEVADFELPAELAIDRGAPICTRLSGCGDSQRFDMVVRLGTDSPADGVEAPHGDSVSIGGMVFLHGGLEEAVRSNNNCYDWGGGSASAALFRAGPEQP